MPYYRCLVPQDSVSFDQRRQVAQAFTDVHCGLTGAPRNFVHVAFFANEGGEFAEPYFIDGGNRAGRPAVSFLPLTCSSFAFILSQATHHGAEPGSRRVSISAERA